MHEFLGISLFSRAVVIIRRRVRVDLVNHSYGFLLMLQTLPHLVMSLARVMTSILKSACSVMSFRPGGSWSPYSYCSKDANA